MKKLGAMVLACMLLWGCRPALGDSGADPHTLRWYYNPKGGQYSHMDPNCPTASPKYHPLQPIPEGMGERRGPPCSYCARSAAPLFSVSGGSGNMPNLQVEVYGTAMRVPQWGDDAVYRIRVTDRDQPDRAFAELLFPSLEDGQGLAPLVRIEDLNFDGYPDLAALRAQGASNAFSTHFLYSPADGQYHYEPVLDNLSAYTLYPRQRLIHNFVHDSAATGMQELYTISQDGRPMLYRRASVLYEEGSGQEKIRIQVADYDATGAQTLWMDELRGPFADEADYRESERKWLELFYQGIPAEVVQGDPGP